ncbi:MAG: LptF/LptG family permease [Nitrospirae bacterium]|nr:LptF/LptG family permease [Nitrospirota bacterium]
MLIIQRHYLKEFFKLLGVIALGLALIFSLLDLVNKIADFMPGNPSTDKLILYALLNLPKYLLYLLPMAVLICSLFIFSQASRRKEIVAIKAAGGRLKALFYPFIISGMLLSIFAFITGEFVVPDFSKRAYELENTLKKKDKKLVFKEGTLWLRSTDGSHVRIELYIPDKKLAKGVSIFKIAGGQSRFYPFGGKSGTVPTFLRERIEAEEAEWEEVRSSKLKVKSSEGIWKLKKVIKYDIESGKVSRISEIDYPYLESPDFFSEKIKKPDEMGLSELYRYTKRLKEAGFRNTKLVVDLNSKVSYPLINFFLMLLGISLPVRGRIGGGLFAAGLGLFISLIYWLGYTLMLSMGYAGIIPPSISAWITPLLFGITAIYLFRKTPE